MSTIKIENYLQLLEKTEASPLTIRNYTHYLKRFMEFAKSTKTDFQIKQINTEMVDKYKKFLTDLELSKKTISFHLISLRSFLKWAKKEGFSVLDYNLIDVPKYTSGKVKFLTGSEVDKLLNSPSLSNINGYRDKAILELFYSTGLRVSELVGLNRESTNFEKKELKIRKRNKSFRHVFVSSRACDWLEKYVKLRKDKYKPLFIRHKGTKGAGVKDEKMRLTARSVQRMLKKYVKKAKLSVDATPQTLRNSFATDLLMAGAEVGQVQEMLGHKNVQTTQVYTHVTHKHLKEVHQAFHGKGGK